jgi:hypothetical protein
MAMTNEAKVWTTVGSAGTLSATDLAKVGLGKSVISLGHSIGPVETGAPEDREAAEPRIGLPTTTAVVRYNITPVAGLFLDGQFTYVLQLTYKGRVQARLGQFSVLTGEDSDVVRFDSASFPPAPADKFATNLAGSTDDSAVMDFVNFAYYVEATLTASAVAVGHPAEIAAVKVFASPVIH